MRYSNSPPAVWTHHSFLLAQLPSPMRILFDLAGRRIALVVLSTPQWPLVRLHMDRIAAAVDAAMPGSYAEVEIPFS